MKKLTHKTKWAIGGGLGLIAVGILFSATSERPIPEKEFIDHLEEKGTFDPDDTVDVTIDNVKNTQFFGWCAYGKDGGLWMSADKPAIKSGHEYVLKPTDVNKIAGSYTIQYKLVK